MKEGWRILQLKPHLLARNMSSTDLIRILKTVKGLGEAGGEQEREEW